MKRLNDMLQKMVSLLNKQKETILFIIGDHSNDLTNEKNSPFLYVFTSEELSSIEVFILNFNYEFNR
jgi:hypothetical protein